MCAARLLEMDADQRESHANVGRCAVAAMAWMCLLATIAVGAESRQAPAAGQSPLAADSPIADRYPGDAGIKQDPAVIFADDFESWSESGAQPPAGTWGMHKNDVSRSRVVPGKVVADGLSGPGAGVLEIACWTAGSGSQAGGLTLKLGNYDHAHEGRGDGYEELFVRYYIRFDENYRGVANHGANLGGRDVSRPGSAWVGMAAIRDIASRGYFYSGLQPYAKNDSRELEMGFYSYHLDKKDQWGANYEVQKHIPVRVGGWHCVERHMKLNSVDRRRGGQRRRHGRTMGGRADQHPQRGRAVPPHPEAADHVFYP